MSHPSNILNRILGIALVLAVFNANWCVIAAASPSSLSRAKAQATQARERLDSLSDDLEERSEEYLAAREQLEITRREVSEAEEELSLAVTAVEVAEQRFDHRVNSIYRHGATNMIAVFLGVTDFRDLVTRLDMLRRVQSSDAELVRDLQRARAQVEADRRRLDTRRSEQMALVKTAADREREVNRALDEQKRYLAQLDGKVKRLVARERARQEQLARERAAQAARTAAEAQAPGELGGPHPEALAQAQRFVGKVDYLWGGTTPSGFDCSGLTQYCYNAIGIDIPRTSRSQFHFGAFIPADRLDLLAPGDLVFFGRGGSASRVHHVGIYAGDGLFVHAPQTGMKVMVSSLYGRIATRADYVGARRP